MANKIQLRGGTAAAATAANVVLAEREIAVETDTKKYKIGDGVTAWNALPYGGLSLASTVETDLDMAALGGEPSTPAAGRMKIYARSIAGRIMPKIVGPSGLDVVLQPFMGGNSVRQLLPGTGTAFTVLNWVTPTAVGTVSTPAIAAGGFRVGCRRSLVTSASTANAASELRQAAMDCLRGDVAGAGGFHLVTTFAMETVVALQRVAVGLIGVTTALATTQSPSALTNCIIVGWDSTDTQVQIMHNDAAGTCTKVALGTSFPITDSAAVYQLDLFAPPNAASVGWRVKRLDSGAIATGTITTDLPLSSQLLAWHLHANNGGTALPVVPSHLRTYLETDN